MENRIVWLSRGPSIPARWDLRLIGWEVGLAGVGEGSSCILMDGRAGCAPPEWRALPAKDRTIVVGVESPADRAAMLAAGFAEALPMEVAVGELAVRFARIIAARDSLPRTRLAGPLRLDLFHRDARHGGRWLALHPREFALLWRLAETPGERVPNGVLMADVWRLQHVPETNSLQVHVSRLRAKLAVAGLAWLVATDPAGGYRLVPHAQADEDWTAASPAHRTLRT